MKVGVYIKLDEKLKKKAQSTAEKMGLSLNSVISHQLEKFIQDEYLVLSKNPNVGKRIERMIQEARDDVRKNRNFTQTSRSDKDIDRIFS